VQVTDGSTFRVEKAFRFDRADAFTLSAWIYPTQKAPLASILSREESGNRNHRGYELALVEDRLSASLIHHWPTDAIQVTAKDPVPHDTWTHVTMTYDGSSRAAGLRIYVNGKPVPVDVDADHLERTVLMTRDRPDFAIGRKFGSTDPSAFEGGKIDEVRVY